MSAGQPPSSESGDRPTIAARLPSTLALVAGVALLAHAALVLATVVPAPDWVPVVECLIASLLGLRQLRHTESEPTPRTADAAPRRASPVPARVDASEPL